MLAGVRSSLALTVAAAASVVLSLHAQTPFRSSTNTVAIYATVLESSGHFAADLTRDDFEIRDDGKPVDITVFSASPQPITLVILLDTSGSMRPYMPMVKDATNRLLADLLPEDRAEIGTFGARTILSPRFTTDRAELGRFLDERLDAGGATPLWNALDIGMVALNDIVGRRVVLVFTDGDDTTTGDHGRDVVKRHAAESDIMVYAIGCWGGRGSGSDRPDSNLRKVAEKSGGQYFELTWRDDVAATFADVASELHHQYVLGFSPSTLDGKTHTLDVRVKPRGLTVRARDSYLAK